MSTKRAPAWSTVMQMEQSRWKRTAQIHADALPPHLAALATANHIGRDQAGRLAVWCTQHNLPIARAGRH